MKKHSKLNGRCYTCVHERICPIKEERETLEKEIMDLTGPARSTLSEKLSIISRSNLCVCVSCDAYLCK